MVAIVMGSKSDLPVMEEAQKKLNEFGIPSEIKIISAHRNPEAVRKFAQNAEKQGIKVIIAGAGGAAALPGVIAAYTTLPVIGVPIKSELLGIDSLLSISQMPKGVPVATMAIGVPGAINAAIFAAEVLALSNNKIKSALLKHKKSLNAQK
ncbi:MAG: 5-(carboxyamino)imidazole ribonucleotide mutase [candidate division WOR-3 bacterium]|nr:5-(carboxyamino)imidazole ribonucleotide mutase [candidate division WOR-3 bacterium]MCX7757619.1 5-(carboxyamino)imidazole ribonucleotide mutase [candidate division WOR-3 bacterium]MDW7987263.1 5-(carboxyamino)imidazole ribonucleotide mutase [candidate division WOR-3 bacterium]